MSILTIALEKAPEMLLNCKSVLSQIMETIVLQLDLDSKPLDMIGKLSTTEDSVGSENSLCFLRESLTRCPKYK